MAVKSPRAIFLMVIGQIVLCIALLIVRVPPAHAAANLTISLITWNVLGLDSNNVNVGPDVFPVAVRVCNTGDAQATNVTTNLVWDSVNALIGDTSVTSLSKPALAAGACADFFYGAVIARNAAAYDTTRRFHITATADGLLTVSTPTPRELYVEHLVSQNRNGVDSITGPGNVEVGKTYSYTVRSHTATGGYEQLEAHLVFPNTAFEVISVISDYAVPAGATNDKLWADACGWDSGPASPTYRSCVGPANYAGGKAGGDPMVTTYTVKVLAAGVFTIPTVIYDYSGSSFHYNNDFGIGINVKTITATVPTAVRLSSFTARPAGGPGDPLRRVIAGEAQALETLAWLGPPVALLAVLGWTRSHSRRMKR